MPLKKSAHLSKIYSFSHSSKTIFSLVSHLLLGYIIIIAALGVFLYLADVILDKEIFSFDKVIINFIYTFRNPMMTEIMKGITFFGGELFLTIAMFCSIVFLYWKSKKNTLIFSFILIFGVILNLLLKSLFHRPRPDFMPLVHESTYSFPSGHAMNSFIFYTAVYFYIFRTIKHKTFRVVLFIVTIILIASIGLSRIYLGAHYPSDVIAGYTAGFLWFLTVLLLDRTLRFFRLYRSYGIQNSTKK